MPENRVWEFNKGEWTEAYVFLKLLSDGRIYGGNNNLERDESVYMDIVNILRYEAGSIYKFERDLTGLTNNITSFADDIQFYITTTEEMAEKASYLYHAIKTATSGARKLSVVPIQEYLMNLRFTSPKSPSLPSDQEGVYGGKTDIVMTVESSIDRMRESVGFSIKSHMGSPSTLFNCGGGSRLVYRIDGCDEQTMHQLNLLNVTEQIQFIKESNNLNLEFIGSKKLRIKTDDGYSNEPVFEWNIQYVDTGMISIINTAVLACNGYYDETPPSNMVDVSSFVAAINPLRVRNPEAFYNTKFKDFLFAAFAGMTASVPWDGTRRINGGYIEVAKDGDIIYYRAISDDVFTSYLMNSVHMEKPERGCIHKLKLAEAKQALYGEVIPEQVIVNSQKSNKKKGDYGYVYKEADGNFYLDINFQVRFRK